MNELVLDISKYDSDIDLAAWKQKHNLWGVIIKAGGHETGLNRYTDSWFERHYANAKAAGLHIGFYYYTVSTNTTDAIKDAEHFANILKGRKYDLPCYMDVEDNRQFALPARNLTDVIKAFCDKLIQLGYYAGLYTGGSAWLNNMYRNELDKYANWIAWWRAKWPYEAGDIGMWQQGGMRYSDGMIVYDDVSGFHDVDWCVVDYPSRINNGDTSYEEDETVPSSGGTADDVISIAEGELGYYAPNDPERGSKYGRWMAQITGEDWMAGPSVEIWWCCMFVSWVLNKAGVEVAGFPSQNTDLALNGGANKLLVERTSIKRGDILIFDWNWGTATTDHIGFAKGSLVGGYVETIEGNVSNSVQNKTRALSTIRYVIRPKYGTKPAPKPDPTPEPEPTPEPTPVIPDGYSTKIYQTNNTPMQHFEFINNNDGYFRIRNIGRDMYLDVRDALSDDHTPVRVWKKLNSDGQLWKLIWVPKAFGTYCELEPKCAPGMRLDVINGGTENKTGIWIHPSNSTDAQRWALIESSDGNIRIASIKSGLVLDAGAGVQPA
jgi:hypothetical protein